MKTTAKKRRQKFKLKRYLSDWFFELSASVTYIVPCFVGIISLTNARFEPNLRGKTARKFYFFRRGFLADLLADLDDGGGGVFSIFRRPSSNPNPFAVMAFIFTLLASILSLF
jgi:hypothetical protein